MPNNPSRLWLQLLAVVVVLGAAGFGVVYYLRPVAQVELVKRQPAPNAKPGSVVVLAERETDLKSEYGGRILRTLLRPGSTFKAGEPLVWLDTRELELNIAKTESDIEAQQKRIDVGSPLDGQIANAKDDVAAKESLFKLGSLAESDFVQAKRAVTQLEQQRNLQQIEDQQRLDVMKNTLSSLRLQLSRMVLTAPFDGDATAVYASQDDIIPPNAPIAHLITSSRLVVAKVSEEDFANIRIGQHASVRFLTYGDPPSNATVTQILPSADPETQRYMVYLKVNIPPEKLVPGITGEVSITVGVHENALTVPRRAVSGHSLYVVNDGRVELRHVELGYMSLNEIEVLSGVQEGEAVIAEQLDQFQPGDRVRISVEKN
ncbi:MAG TPA: efflux RND transporter periplasmic adaptor subunit [Opitutaceae bacterium]|nr:efflux RND transporter periplasmic adaptor subunit [Opitutaceae bacterium]